MRASLWACVVRRTAALKFHPLILLLQNALSVLHSRTCTAQLSVDFMGKSFVCCFPRETRTSTDLLCCSTIPAQNQSIFPSYNDTDQFLKHSKLLPHPIWRMTRVFTTYGYLLIITDFWTFKVGTWTIFYLLLVFWILVQNPQNEIWGLMVHPR